MIELMIVMAIVAIIVTMGVPPFVRALRKEGLRKAVSDVVEGCSHARAQAILQGVPTELVIRADQISVRQLQPRQEETVDGELFPTKAVAARKPTPAFKAHLPDDIAITFLYVNFQDQMDKLETRVRFFPNATCDEFTMILSSATEKQQVSLDVITGLADVKLLP